MKVLVADDSKTMRTMVLRHLRQHGIDNATFLEAVDGTSALELVNSERPDLVICSWELPVISGLELCQKIGGESGCVFVMVMADRTAENRALAKSAGARFLVSKPLTPESFEPALGALETSR